MSKNRKVRFEMETGHCSDWMTDKEAIIYLDTTPNINIIGICIQEYLTEQEYEEFKKDLNRH